MFKRKEKIYEGELKEQCKKARKRWILLSFWGFVMPLLISIVYGWYTNETKIPDIFNNGDVLLALYSVTVPATLDIFEIKKQEDIKLTTVFSGFLLLILFQTIFFVLIKNDNSNNQIKGIVFSLIIVAVAIYWCLHSLKEATKYQYNISKESEVDNNGKN